MKTLVAKSVAPSQRKWHIVDAAGKNLGRLSTQIARTLSGRNRVDFTPHLDNGDYVIVINTKDIAVTGNKEVDKMYYRHSGYLGGIKQKSLGKMRVKNPNYILEHAVAGMLPKNKLRPGMIARLKLESTSQHQYAAQKPEPLALV